VLRAQFERGRRRNFDPDQVNRQPVGVDLGQGTHVAAQTGGKDLGMNDNVSPNFGMCIIRGNQPPVSAARWQHCSQICFATFIL